MFHLKDCLILKPKYKVDYRVGTFTCLQKTKHLSCHSSSRAGKLDVLTSTSVAELLVDSRKAQLSFTYVLLIVVGVKVHYLGEYFM